MRIGQQVAPLAQAFAAALMLTALGDDRRGARARRSRAPTRASSQHKPTAQDNALVRAVREATERFKHVTSVAGPGEGYELAFGCVSGGDFGAMGLHYVNMSLVDGVLDVESSRDRAVRADVERRHPDHRRRLRRTRRRMGCRTRNSASGACGSAGADGSAVPSVRQSESVRARPVLHAARLGVEGQSQRDVRELEP